MLIGAGRHAGGSAAMLLAFVAAIGAQAPMRGAQAVVPVDQVTALKARYPFVRFSLLSSFEVPDLPSGPLATSPHATRSHIQTLMLPEEIVKRDGQAVSIRGYMLPLAIDGDRVTDFLLSDSIDSCHFGKIGAINQWVVVWMAAGRTVPFPKAIPITVFGHLSVGLEAHEGLLTSLYRLSGDMIAIH